MTHPEKRYLPRWEVANRISYHLSHTDNPQEGKSRDLSSVGICLETKELLPIDSKVKLVVYLSEDRSFPVDGRVMWCHATAEGYKVGIRFEGISAHDQDQILRFAFEVRPSDVVNHWFEGWKKE